MYILLAFLAALADVAGGLLPLHPRFRSIGTRYALAFASGAVVSAAFFDLLPESDVKLNWPFLGAGFFIMYLIDKGLALHQCAERDCELTGVSWITVIGMAADNVIDGAGIAISYLTHAYLGIVVTLAVIAHEIPQGFTTTLVMKAQGRSTKSILAMLSLAGIMYPVGASLNVLIPSEAYPAAIAFVAGVFIYIGAHALMTEAHRRFNLRVMGLLLLGSLVVLIARFIE